VFVRGALNDAMGKVAKARGCVRFSAVGVGAKEPLSDDDVARLGSPIAYHPDEKKLWDDRETRDQWVGLTLVFRKAGSSKARP
jgi:hypothetical protein